jgi:hypothetical protein
VKGYLVGFGAECDVQGLLPPGGYAFSGLPSTVSSMERSKSISTLWLGVQFALTGIGILVAVKLIQGVPAATLLDHPSMLFEALKSR